VLPAGLALRTLLPPARLGRRSGVKPPTLLPGRLLTDPPSSLTSPFSLPAATLDGRLPGRLPLRPVKLLCLPDVPLSLFSDGPGQAASRCMASSELQPRLRASCGRAAANCRHVMRLPPCMEGSLQEAF
jgi:hypothetical protein